MSVNIPLDHDLYRYRRYRKYKDIEKQEERVGAKRSQMREQPRMLHQQCWACQGATFNMLSILPCVLALEAM